MTVGLKALQSTCCEKQTALFYFYKREADNVMQQKVKESFPFNLSILLHPFAQLAEHLGVLTFPLFKFGNNTKQREYPPYTYQFNSQSRSRSYYEKTIWSTVMCLNASIERVD